MKRFLIYVFIPCLAAAASAANIMLFWLNTMMRETRNPVQDFAEHGAEAAIVIFTAAAIFAARRRPLARRLIFAVSIVLVLAAGFVPRVVDLALQSLAAASDQAAGADLELQFQSDLLDRNDDIDQRIAAKKPYSATQALDFLEFAADADLSWRSLPDHTPEVFALVEQAISEGILDPNALMTATPTADTPPETVTLAFFDKRIRQGAPSAIRKHDWDVLQILVAKGADLSADAAATLRADLAKAVVLGPGRFLRLE
jgi:hypothetical protein